MASAEWNKFHELTYLSCGYLDALDIDSALLCIEDSVI